MLDNTDKLLIAETKRVNRKQIQTNGTPNRYLFWLRCHKKKVGIAVFAMLIISILSIVLALLLYSSKIPAQAKTNFNVAWIHRDSTPGTFALDGALFKNVMVSRVAGMKGNLRVRMFIVKMLKDYGWDVKIDTFKDKTEMGEVEFNNIIATIGSTDKNDPSCVVIGAHYDSKLFPGEKFLGATDAAAPVVILIDLAKYLGTTLTRITSHYSVKIVFFDGEESFGRWDYNSALYGSRHLKELWKSSGFLKNIRFLLLLDLLGHTETSVLNIPQNDSVIYKKILDVQEEFRANIQSSFLRKRLEVQKGNLYFKNKMYNTIIEDDDLPFRKENVKTVNLITVPFPTFHHTLHDSPDKLNPNVIHDISTIVKKFIVTSLIKNSPPAKSRV